jgi:NOL1/NOP2/fmu family ribosome biogenesis protein
VLLYATCSYSPEEDEAVLRWLAGEHQLERIEVPVPTDWGLTRVEAGGLHGYRCFPDKVKGEGFFIAALRKAEPSRPFFYPRFRAATHKKADEASRQLLRGGSYSFLEDPRKNVSAIYAWHEPDFHLLDETLYLRRSGLALGRPSQKEWIPGHDLALSLDKNPGLPRWELTRGDALNFLRKEELNAPEGLPKGWCLACYEGRALGWVKVLSGRVNNYLPKGWRIRMELPADEL